MRYRLSGLVLLTVLPAMSVLAAPVPDPSAILDIGSPPKDERQRNSIANDLSEPQTFHGTLCTWWSDLEVRKQPSVARFKDARPWLAKNLRVTAEPGGRRLRFTFQAGSRAEQVVILNALLRENLAVAEDAIKLGKEGLRRYENNILELEKRIKSSRNPQEAALYRKGINELRTDLIPACCANIARWKQIAAIKWAK